jgi:adenine-specific DNA-methyltransferase
MMERVNRIELVWPGKYDEAGNLFLKPTATLPFQIVERVNETRATRLAREESESTLFDVWNSQEEGISFEQGWRNKLIWGDNKAVMGSLSDQFSGKVDLIYMDPPFAVGSDFSIDVSIGDENLSKKASIIEEVAFRDTWGRGFESFLSMIYERISLAHGLLAETGSLYLHCDYRVSAQIRLILDEIFGVENFRNEIIWGYNGGGVPKNAFAKKHDTIFFFAKSDKTAFNIQYQPYSESSQKLITARGGTSIDGKERDLSRGSHMVDWWGDINALQTFSPERLKYPTQKPEKLLERIISASSNPGDLVADFFAGSGTTIAVAEKMNRRWIGADLGRFAIHTSRKRLLDIENCKPFDLLNLGNYERQYWSSLSFGEDLDGDGKVNLLEYIAFILKLYGAVPMSGGIHLHGKKSNAFVHVGYVSSPVTIQEIEESISECVAMEGKILHVLGWEWEMGLIDTLSDFAHRKGVKLMAFQIPREIMEDEAARKGDLKFFELSYLEAEIEASKKLEAFCRLVDFVIPNPELIPENVREKVKNWSDYIDFWAIDWDFKNDTFMPSWMEYRTKSDRNLALKSAVHVFEEPGLRKVMVKVIDIFGNDTSKILDFKAN